jgi:hypothetical protein
LVALVLGRRGYTRMEHTHTMEGLLTHFATSDCFITTPHPALECGIVTAWWQSQVEADTAMRWPHEDAQGRHVPGEQIT